MSQKLFVLISTLNNRIEKLPKVLLNVELNIQYIISHQVTQTLETQSITLIKTFEKREDIIYNELACTGVAKNRNNTFKYIEPDSICLILDDDVTLCEDIYKNILDAFNENPTMDFISFKILDENNKDYKNYPMREQEHTWKTLTGIGTTEMAFKSDLILQNNIIFDEKFGPGSDIYPIGEDFIFAMDLYKMKTRMLFLPIPIVRHPQDSTGRSLEEKVIFGRGAMFARVFGWKAFFIDFLFSVKKYPTYRKKISFIAYCLLLVKGTNDYFTSHEKRVS